MTSMATPLPSAEPIAIIGMAGRFPGAPDVDALWSLLHEAREAITRFTDDELSASGISALDLADPAYVKAGGVLDDTDKFDAPFFSYSPKEAALMDPQHRNFLECAWHALESCGRAAREDRAKAGVFACCGPNTYLLNNVLANGAVHSGIDPHQLLIAGDKDFLATRAAYLLDMRGPSLTVQTACSSSLVAVHLACQSLRGGECNMALAGGVSLRYPMRAGYRYTPQGILSPDGHCRAFDQAAAGTVFGNGIGVVVLKRLRDALADGDTIRAIILGSAVNNDGNGKPGYTAPSVEGQVRALSRALANAEAAPESITFLEAHGTGTELGDAVEFAALAGVFPPRPDKQPRCALGAVKTNIGHLDAASGAAGLIKAVLALEHRQIPATLHFQAPGDKIPMRDSAFFVPTQTQAWESSGTPRRALVSSLGIGGTNANVVLEEAPPPDNPLPPESEPAAHVLVWSAKDEAAADELGKRLHAMLTARRPSALADLAYTLQHGREHFAVRRMMVADDTMDAVQAFSEPGHPRISYSTSKGRPKLAFCFPGQGAGYADMGRSLYAAQPAFRALIDDCAARLRSLEASAAADTLLSPPAGPLGTALAQPVLFCLEYALAQWWIGQGVTPDALLGHSLGEYTAACLAGVYDLDDALRLVIARGKLMEQLPPGRMLAVRLPESEADHWLVAYGLDLAAVNSPHAVVLSGTSEDLDRAAAAMAAEGIPHQWLGVDKAFHSVHTDAVLAEFRTTVNSLRLNPPRIPVISNVTGSWLDADQAVAPEYWVRHLRATVRFSDGAGTLLRTGEYVAIEIGPGDALNGMLRQQRSENLRATFPGLGRQSAEEVGTVAQTLGELWLLGTPVKWPMPSRRRRVAIPAYPFTRRRFWIDPSPAEERQPETSPLAKLPIDRWFHQLSWRRSHDCRRAPDLSGRKWLLLHESTRWSADLAKWLDGRLAGLACVTPGSGFSAGEPGAFERMLQNLPCKPDRIVNALTGQAQAALRTALILVQAVMRTWPHEPPPIDVILPGTWAVTGTESALEPEFAAVAGITLTARQEYPQLRTRCVDAYDVLAHGTWATLAAALERDDGRHLVACRGGFCWHQEYLPFSPSPSASKPDESAPVYLVTGGLGGVGAALAAGLLAHRKQARLALVGRTQLPPHESREQWLQTAAENDPTRQRLERLQALESLSDNVAVFDADVGDAGQVGALVTAVEQRFGHITGWVHAAGEMEFESFRPLMDMAPANLELQWRTKVLGATHLMRALGDRPLEFGILVSSVSTVLGGLGFAAYCAVNQVLDALAERARLEGRPILSVAWDAWRVNEERNSKFRVATAPAIDPEEGSIAFARLLDAGAQGTVAVSVTSLQERIRRWVSAPADPKRDGLQTASVSAGQPIGLEGSLGEVAAVWREMLGVETIDASAHFFELGGDSLIATHLMARINRLFGTNVPVRALFEHPTLGELVGFIEAVQWTLDGKKRLLPAEEHEAFEEGVL